MIRPQRNLWRDALDLGGLWKFRADPEGVGEAQGWQHRLDTHLRVAVPGSWNEQLAESGLMTYTGAAWLETEVFVPPHFAGRRLALYVSTADFHADAWVNGEATGSSGSLFLPFELEIGAHVRPGETARVTLRVANLLREDDITQPVTANDYLREGRSRDEIFPAVRFDFFPYGGLSRPVWLAATPHAGVEAIAIDTRLDGTAGIVSVRATLRGDCDRVRVRIVDGDSGGDGDGERDAARTVANAEAARSGSFASIDLKIGGVRPWSPGDPHLYTVVVEPLRAGSPCDRTVHRIGVRDVRVEGSRLLFNGEPVFLRGFGKHEDSPVRGRGLDLPLLVKDFGLLEWIGANSVRTSHYPYDESFLDLADERGVLVISEIPSINLDFRRVTEHTLATHERAVTAQIARDRNHPSVILWSLANEPGYLGEQQYAERSGAYWRRLFEHARALDPSRPLTCAQVQRHGPDDPVFAACDVLSINRYYGWYDHPGQLDTAAALLQAELDALAARHGKPILVAEFGADTVAGLHATYDQLFTEEYQEAFLRRYLEVIERHPATIGAHVWNFADFRTAQHFRRVVLNLKGVFTRTREPKRAAFALKELWSRAPARR